MGARDDWYRTGAWDEAARAQFDTKIRRTRAGYNRAQYFWIKSGCLFHARPPTRELRLAAIALLERALFESGATRRDRAELLDHLGRYQLIMGQRDVGLSSLREALELGGPRGQSSPPTEALLARDLAQRGDLAGAFALYDVAFPMEGPFARRPSYATLAAREIFAGEIGEDPYRDPEKAAEAIVVYFHALDELDGGVPEIFRADLESLAAVDRVFAIEEDLDRPHAPLAFAADFRERHLVPELGAYVGRVMCRVGGGTWRARVPLMQSRVVIGGRELDPFRVAYDAAYHELPLEPAVRAMLQSCA